MEKSKISKIKNIISNIIVFGLFIIVAVQLVFKFSGHTPYFFGMRYDVVLTDSMSEVNKEYADFLEGHDDQLKPFDYIVSKKINEKTELNIYDIVIYKHPLFGSTVHRIVDIKEINGTIKYGIRADKVNYMDGYFTRDALIAKVDHSIPKFGKFIAFMQSMYGQIMVIGLAVIISTFSYLSQKNEEKEQKAASNESHDEIDDSPSLALDNSENNDKS